MKKYLQIFRFFLILAFFFHQNPALAEEIRAACVKKGQVCLDANSTKKINGVDVTKECWDWQDTYECLEPNPADFCAPLKKPEAKCAVEGQKCLEKDGKTGECLRYEHLYTCDVDIKTLNNGKLPPEVKEREHTHVITSDWDDSKCDAAGKSCKVVETKCLEGPATKVINGVSVTKDCWKEERTMQCDVTTDDINECKQYESNSKCKVKETKCVSKLADGTCQIEETKYLCQEKDGAYEQQNSCVDKDFGKAISTMEMAREMQRYYDPATQTFFKGEVNHCSIKLGGALDGLMGGDCCNFKGDPGTFVDFVKMAGTQMAAQYFMASVASHYTYTTIFVNQAAAALSTSASAAAGFVGSTAELSGMGMTATAVDGIGIQFAFNPAVFAIAIAIIALQNWMKCSQADTLTSMKKKAGLCHQVGSFCSKKVLGACVTKSEGFCCYVSKLTKIINIAGKAQLKRGFGSPENPDCAGFTAQEIEKIDLSKADLSEFYDDIVANMGNFNTQTAASKDKAQEKMKQGKNKIEKGITGTYYDM